MTETAARPQLSDRYTATSGRVQLTGVQALARLPIDQHRRDLAAGLNVGTFVSGYEGSPLAGYDQELGRLHLDERGRGRTRGLHRHDRRQCGGQNRDDDKAWQGRPPNPVPD